MPTHEYYQRQAELLFTMARTRRAEPDVAAKLIDRANEYLLLADTVSERPTLTPASQPQAQQQQQQRKQQEGQNC